MKHSNPGLLIDGLPAREPRVTDQAVVNAIAFAETLDISIHDRIDALKDEWISAEKTANISVYQRYYWVETYLNTHLKNSNIQPFIIVGRLNGEVVFILPCTLHGKFWTRVKFIGGTHVNFNMGIFPHKYHDIITPQCFNHIFTRIQKLVPGLGYLALCCQPESWKGKANPLLCKPHQRSANPGFLLNLEGGFEATLARGNGKRKRKKFRQQVRQCEASGGHSLHMPTTAGEISELVDTFLEQKSKRLKSMGIRNVFADATARDFLIELASRPLGENSPLLQLYALKIGGSVAAIFGAGAMGSHLSGYFSSIDIDRYSEISPGEMLLYLVVEDACKKGFDMLDLGAGDERYKRSWSSEKIDMYEVFIPYNYSATPIVYLRRLYGTVRRIIRENENSWNAYKYIRKMFSPINPGINTHLE